MTTQISEKKHRGRPRKVRPEMTAREAVDAMLPVRKSAPGYFTKEGQLRIDVLEARVAKLEKRG